TTLILRPGSPTCWRGSPISPRTKSRICFRGIGKRHASRSRPDPRLSRQTRSARGAHRMHTEGPAGHHVKKTRIFHQIVSALVDESTVRAIALIKYWKDANAEGRWALSVVE